MVGVVRDEVARHGESGTDSGITGHLVHRPSAIRPVCSPVRDGVHAEEADEVVDREERHGDIFELLCA